MATAETNGTLPDRDQLDAAERNLTYALAIANLLATYPNNSIISAIGELQVELLNEASTVFSKLVDRT